MLVCARHPDLFSHQVIPSPSVFEKETDKIPNALDFIDIPVRTHLEGEGTRKMMALIATHVVLVGSEQSLQSPLLSVLEIASPETPVAYLHLGEVR